MIRFLVSCLPVAATRSGDCVRDPGAGSTAEAGRELASGDSPVVLEATFSWQQVFVGRIQVLRNLYQLLLMASRKVQHSEKMHPCAFWELGAAGGEVAEK